MKITEISKRDDWRTDLQPGLFKDSYWHSCSEIDLFPNLEKMAILYSYMIQRFCPDANPYPQEITYLNLKVILEAPQTNRRQWLTGLLNNSFFEFISHIIFLHDVAPDTVRVVPFKPNLCSSRQLTRISLRDRSSYFTIDFVI